MKKFKKGLLTFALMFAVAFASFGLVACGDENEGGDNGGSQEITATKWSGNVGTVPEAQNNVIEISTGEQLAGFAKAVNDNREEQRYLENYTVKLVADINLDDKEWTPIGNNASQNLHYVFAGIFDGNGHTIYKLNVTASADKNDNRAGLFGSLLGSVQNLTIKYATLSTSWMAGTIAAYVPDGATKDIKNCHVENAVITSTAEFIEAENKYDNANNVGGLIGYTAASNVENCSIKNAVITAYRDVGGLVGKADSMSYSPVSVKNNTVGENVVIKIDNTHNYKNFTSNESYNAGSFVGRGLNNPTIENNAGSVTIEYPNN